VEYLAPFGAPLPLFGSAKSKDANGKSGGKSARETEETWLFENWIRKRERRCHARYPIGGPRYLRP
jgi:hypothetical protein